MSETDRIKEVYALRKVIVPKELYSYFNNGNLFIVQRREQAILNFLDKYSMNPLDNKAILDVGCGKGGVLRDFIKYGAKPENCFGIDLLEDRIKEAKILSPNIKFRRGNAENMPYYDKSFDIILSFTLFSSILDNNMKKNIANEMLRVLKQDGIIIWYDYWISKHTNSDVKGVGKKEIKKLFSDCKIHIKRITVAPPLVRLIAPYSYLLCYILEQIPLLKTHYLAIIKKSK